MMVEQRDNTQDSCRPVHVFAGVYELRSGCSRSDPPSGELEVQSSRHRLSSLLTLAMFEGSGTPSGHPCYCRHILDGVTNQYWAHLLIGLHVELTVYWGLGCLMMPEDSGAD